MADASTARRSIFAVWHWKWRVWTVVVPVAFFAYLVSACPMEFFATRLWLHGFISYEMRSAVFMLYQPADMLLFSNDFTAGLHSKLWLRLSENFPE